MIQAVCYPIPMDVRAREIALIEVLHSDLDAAVAPQWLSSVSDNRHTS